MFINPLKTTDTNFVTYVFIRHIIMLSLQCEKTIPHLNFANPVKQ